MSLRKTAEGTRPFHYGSKIKIYCDSNSSTLFYYSKDIGIISAFIPEALPRR